VTIEVNAEEVAAALKVDTEIYGSTGITEESSVAREPTQGIEGVVGTENTADISNESKYCHILSHLLQSLLHILAPFRVSLLDSH
jgi:hypothetical protein